MKTNELEEIWQGIIDGFNEAIDEAKAAKVKSEFDEAIEAFNEPTTVEEFDEAIPDIPNLEPEQILLPKPDAVANQCLDIIGNTLKQTTPISESQADTMLKLAQLRIMVLNCGS